SRLERALAVLRTERRPSAEYHERLVVPVMEVVWTLRLSGQELVETKPELSDAEPFVVRLPTVGRRIRVVPFVCEDVHAASFGSGHGPRGSTRGSSRTRRRCRRRASRRASRSTSRAGGLGVLSFGGRSDMFTPLRSNRRRGLARDARRSANRCA